MVEASMERKIQEIMDMGFTRKNALDALKHGDGDVVRAIEYIIERGAHSEPPSQLVPATREYYDPEKWGLVVCEAKPEPDEKTKDNMSTPPVLVHSHSVPRIGPLLTILARIPQAKRALLFQGRDLVPEYVYTPDWWKPGGVQSTLLADLADTHFLSQVQRLAAFVAGSSSPRAYASADTFCLPGLPESSIIGRFLLDLVSAEKRVFGPDSPLDRVLCTEALPDRAIFADLTVEVTVAHKETLYDLVDEMIWAGAAETTYLDRVAQVIILALKRDDGMSGAGIDVPATWCPHRYSLPYAPYVHELRNRRKQYQLTRGIVRRKQFTHNMYKGKDISKILTTTIKYLREIQHTQPEAAKALEEVSNLAHEYEGEKMQLARELDAVQTQLEQEHCLFKNPGVESSPLAREIFPNLDLPPLPEYTIHGAIIDPGTFFFKHELQWFRVDGTNVTSCSLDQVLAAIKTGSKNHSWHDVVVVYASAASLEPDSTCIPPSLQRFFDRDRDALSSQRQNVNGDPEIEHVETVK